MIKKLKEQEILNIISNCKCVGIGNYGIIFQYDDDTLWKFYYKNFFDFYHTKDINELKKAVAINLETEKEMLEMFNDYIIEKDRLVNVIKFLNSIDYSLIKGIATYNDYPIGIFLEYYKGYFKLEEVFVNFNSEQKLVVLENIKVNLFRLFKSGVYPLDLKESNILVNVESFDVKFIDLDGVETRYENRMYIKEFSYIKKEAINAYDSMVKRLSLK